MLHINMQVKYVNTLAMLDDIKQVCKYVNTLAMLDRYKGGM